MQYVEPQNELKAIKAESLSQKLTGLGYQNTRLELVNKEDVIATGKLSFVNRMDGVSLHYCDMHEANTGKSTVSLSACLSFNFLLEGHVSFQLNNHEYQFDTKHKKPICFVNVITESTLFCRFLKQHNYVRKLNITIEKEWLSKRCVTAVEKQLLSELFNAGAKVYPLAVTPDILVQVQELAAYQTSLSLHNNLAAECVAILIVNKLLTQIKEQIKQPLATRIPSVVDERVCSIKLKLDELAGDHLSLAHIATELGYSTSTLQRKFKLRHSITVQDYIRQNKLEKAKQAIVFEQLSLGEAAYQAGYNHVSNFITAFKKQYGLSPAALKKQYEV